MNLVVPFGFYGAGNIGDEATLQGFARLLMLEGNGITNGNGNGNGNGGGHGHSQGNAATRVSVASRDPAHTARVEPAFTYFNASGRDPKRWWAKLRASAQAFVGGTPIMDVLGAWPLCEVVPLVRSAERRGAAIAFVGIGTETLQQEESRRIVAAELAPRVRHWSVRCDRDRQRLIDWDVSPDRITVASDLAWLLEPAPTQFGRDRLRQWAPDGSSSSRIIGVNLVNENGLFEQNRSFVRALAHALDALVEKLDARVLFLSNEVRKDPCFDRAAACQVIAQMKRSSATILAPNAYFSPSQMMSIIGCCDLTISMRYHFCVFSALQGVPFVAIERSDKVADLCWDLDWPASVAPAPVQTDEIVEHFTRLDADRTQLLARLRQRIELLRLRAMLNSVALATLRRRTRSRTRRPGGGSNVAVDERTLVSQ
jgi:polysaccharide pyruvyl transferase WcaK-like protein